MHWQTAFSISIRLPSGSARTVIHFAYLVLAIKISTARHFLRHLMMVLTLLELELLKDFRCERR